MNEANRPRPPAQVAEEAEALAQFLEDFLAFDLDEDGPPNTKRDNLKRAAAFIREAYPKPPDEEPSVPTIREHLVKMRDELALLAAQCNLARYFEDAGKAQACLTVINDLSDGDEFDFAAWPPTLTEADSDGERALVSAIDVALKEIGVTKK